MQHDWKHVERPGGSHTALDGKKDEYDNKREKDIYRKGSSVSLAERKSSLPESECAAASGVATLEAIEQPCIHPIQSILSLAPLKACAAEAACAACCTLCRS